MVAEVVLLDEVETEWGCNAGQGGGVRGILERNATEAMEQIINANEQRHMGRLYLKQLRSDRSLSHEELTAGCVREMRKISFLRPTNVR